MHYTRYKRFGDPVAVVRYRGSYTAAEANCAVADCTLPRIKRSWCHMHYERWKKTGDPVVSPIPRCLDCGVELSQGGKRRCQSCATSSPCEKCGTPRVPVGRQLICRPCMRPVRNAEAQLRRARRRNAVCDHGPECVTAEHLTLLRAQRCLYCGAQGEHADHFFPLARGGMHCVRNLVPACAACNLSKNDRDPWQWWGDLLRG